MSNKVRKRGLRLICVIVFSQREECAGQCDCPSSLALLGSPAPNPRLSTSPLTWWHGVVPRERHLRHGRPREQRRLYGLQVSIDGRHQVRGLQPGRGRHGWHRRQGCSWGKGAGLRLRVRSSCGYGGLLGPD